MVRVAAQSVAWRLREEDGEDNVFALLRKCAIDVFAIRTTISLIWRHQGPLGGDPDPVTDWHRFGSKKCPGGRQERLRWGLEVGHSRAGDPQRDIRCETKGGEKLGFHGSCCSCSSMKALLRFLFWHCDNSLETFCHSCSRRIDEVARKERFAR